MMPEDELLDQQQWIHELTDNLTKTLRADTLWALDVEDGWPIRAHRIVETRTANVGSEVREERVTTCGKVLNRWNHPKGWWSGPAGELPLQDHAIHCS